MEKKRLSKIDAALRQELANAIHDMDDGKLQNNRLHTLAGKINNKLYHDNQDDYEEEDEEEEYILSTVSTKMDSYVDDIKCSMDEYELDDYFNDIRYEIEEMTYASSKKDALKLLKSTEKSFKALDDYLDECVETANDNVKMAAITKKSLKAQLNKLKADFAKDIKKADKNANK